MGEVEVNPRGCKAVLKSNEEANAHETSIADEGEGADEARHVDEEGDEEVLAVSWAPDALI